MEDELLPALRDAAWDADPRFTDRERAALRYTDAYWHDHTRVDRAFVHDVLRHLREDEFIELAVLVAQFTGMGKLFAILGIPNPAFVALDDDAVPPA